MKTVRQTCVPRAATFDPARRDTVLDLSDLIENKIDPASFFAENHLTEGMRTLLTEAFRRLEGKSTQGVFKLTQAMGGGKTHNLLVLGLLARHPELRTAVMGDFYRPDDIGAVRVVAFSGRESDAPFGVWGAIADQLGKREQFSAYYSPLSAPGQTAWVKLLRGDPLVIMLDELPPYFVHAASHSIGNSDLSVVTTTALANLLVAVGRHELGQRLCRDVRSHRVLRRRQRADRTPCGSRRRATVTRRTASHGCAPSLPTTTGHGVKSCRRFFDTWRPSRSTTGARTPPPPGSWRGPWRTTMYDGSPLREPICTGSAVALRLAGTSSPAAPISPEPTAPGACTALRRGFPGRDRSAR